MPEYLVWNSLGSQWTKEKANNTFHYKDIDLFLSKTKIHYET